MLRVMRPTSNSRIGLALLALTLLTAFPAAADLRFRARQMTRDDVPFGKGQCDIRLQVDSEVQVSVRGDSINVRTISGQEPRDDGSECNYPLPDRDLRDFNFEVKDSRNDIGLVEPPSPRNGFTAIVRIRDTSGGFGRYHFRLSWLAAGGPGSGGFTGGGRPPDFERDRPGGGGGGGFAWNNVVHFSGQGQGRSNLTGFGQQRLFDANVDIDRGGRIQVSFTTNSGRPIGFVGTVIGRDGDVLKAEVAGDERMLRLRGPMYITLRGRENVTSISLEATNGRDNLRLNWDRR